jgi:predicted transcriptional regulator with HTH domain
MPFVKILANFGQNLRVKGLRQLCQIGLLDINLPDGTKKYLITTVQKEQKKLLTAYNIKKVDVPNVV